MPPTPSPAARSPAAPHRRLAAALAPLHRALLTAQAVGSPAATNPYALLQAVLHDPAYAWLKGFSDLMLQIDEAGAKGATPTPEAMAGFRAAAAALVEGEGETARRVQALALRPEIAAATAELRATLATLAAA